MKVIYIQHEEEIQQWATPNKQWWIDFADKWDHTEIIGFIDIEVTEDMQLRYEEIKDMPEDFSDLYTEYILSGDVSDDIELSTNHPFNIIRLRKENNRLKNVNEAVIERADFTDSVLMELITQVYIDTGGENI